MKFYSTYEKCRWCGESYGLHASYPPMSAPATRVPCGMLKAAFLPIPDPMARDNVHAALLDVAALLNSGCKDYLTVYEAWSKARAAMDGFLENPDWLEEWINARTPADAPEGPTAVPAAPPLEGRAS